ncbi:small heat shock protein [Boletus edulis]|uniref:Small heat shock protein n=1 Tax=Boletus edulis BED1 TaxID=1328754 RepID=A0AAD4BGX4_BOLED|nr:small heat shock protein [Boletus edulis]KAF8428429.1 small heat shock protein [Boletus edulis BED1]
MSSLIRLHYDPFAEFDHLFDDVFNARFWSSTFPSGVDQRASALDLYESKDSNVVTVTFELPGLKSEDVTIDLHHNRLTVSGESATSNSHEEDGYAAHERHYGKFSRTLQLPFGTKPEDVTAKMEIGLLTLTFPKATDQQPQYVAIQ